MHCTRTALSNGNNNHATAKQTKNVAGQLVDAISTTHPIRIAPSPAFVCPRRRRRRSLPRSASELCPQSARWGWGWWWWWRRRWWWDWWNWRTRRTRRTRRARWPRRISWNWQWKTADRRTPAAQPPLVDAEPGGREHAQRVDHVAAGPAAAAAGHGIPQGHVDGSVGPDTRGEGPAGRAGGDLGCGRGRGRARNGHGGDAER